jgi:hypothetical protein
MMSPTEMYDRQVRGCSLANPELPQMPAPKLGGRDNLGSKPYAVHANAYCTACAARQDDPRTGWQWLEICCGFWAATEQE